jgi:hypothetical protein
MAGIAATVSGQEIDHSEADIAGGAGDPAGGVCALNPSAPTDTLFTVERMARPVAVLAVVVPSSGQRRALLGLSRARGGAVQARVHPSPKLGVAKPGPVRGCSDLSGSESFPGLAGCCRPAPSAGLSVYGATGSAVSDSGRTSAADRRGCNTESSRSKDKPHDDGFGNDSPSSRRACARGRRSCESFVTPASVGASRNGQAATPPNRADVRRRVRRGAARPIAVGKRVAHLAVCWRHAR